MPSKSVFFSHSEKDDPLVRQLRQSLEALDIEVWTDSERLTAGDKLDHKIKTAIETAGSFVVLVTINSLNSQWVDHEIEHAKTVTKPGYKIIPIKQPDIGPQILKRLIGVDTLGITLGTGPSAIAEALPAIRAALGLQLPTETIQPTIAPPPPTSRPRPHPH